MFRYVQYTHTDIYIYKDIDIDIYTHILSWIQKHPCPSTLGGHYTHIGEQLNTHKSVSSCVDGVFMNALDHVDT